MCFSLFTLRYTKSDTSYNYTYTIIILYLYINFASAPKLYFIFDRFEKYTQRVPKSSINEVLLATFHEQEQKLLDFWVFFVVLQWVTLKQMMVQVLENLVIYGTHVWNRSYQGSLDNPLVHLFLRVLWQMCLNVLD